MNQAESYESIWDAIAETPEEATNLRIRAELIHKITEIVGEKAWTQAEVAQHCGLPQPRINDLLGGRISRFSLDALVNIAISLGLRVTVELDSASKV